MVDDAATGVCCVFANLKFKQVSVRKLCEARNRRVPAAERSSDLIVATSRNKSRPHEIGVGP